MVSPPPPSPRCHFITSAASRVSEPLERILKITSDVRCKMRVVAELFEADKPFLELLARLFSNSRISIRAICHLGQTAEVILMGKRDLGGSYKA
jgi:hypothetical protein